MAIVIYDGPDAAADWQPEGGGDDMPRQVCLKSFYYHTATTRRMDIDAALLRRRAYQRGLLSAEEHEAHEYVIATHPTSWRGWIRSMPVKRGHHE